MISTRQCWSWFGKELGHPIEARGKRECGYNFKSMARFIWRPFRIVFFSREAFESSYFGLLTGTATVVRKEEPAGSQTREPEDPVVQFHFVGMREQWRNPVRSATPNIKRSSLSGKEGGWVCLGSELYIHTLPRMIHCSFWYIHIPPPQGSLSWIYRLGAGRLVPNVLSW